MTIQIEINNDQSHLPVDEARLRGAVEAILHDRSIVQAEISLAVVDDDTIRRLHHDYLGQDEPTDVMSFVLEREGDRLEAEVVVSVETAVHAAPSYGWTAAEELLLYVIHGTLHLVGFDDVTPAERAEMRRRERFFLARCGVDVGEPPTVEGHSLESGSEVP